MVGGRLGWPYFTGPDGALRAGIESLKPLIKEIFLRILIQRKLCARKAVRTPRVQPLRQLDRAIKAQLGKHVRGMTCTAFGVSLYCEH